MSQMKTISIRELHQETGRWVRQAAAGEVLVTERGKLIAKIVPRGAAVGEAVFRGSTLHASLPSPTEVASRGYGCYRDRQPGSQPVM